MGFMKPQVERFAAYHVETEQGTEIVPERACGELKNVDSLTPYESTESLARLEPYLRGSRIEGAERKEGYYARLSASGYLDCTDWNGPYPTPESALRSLAELYGEEEEESEVG